MIVLVTGGRDHAEGSRTHERVFTALDRLRKGSQSIVVVEGGCPTGVDLFAREWVEYHLDEGMPLIYYKSFPADWTLDKECRGHKHSRRDADPCRNGRMIAWVQSQHDDILVLACPGGYGTANCVRQACAARLTVKTLDEVLDAK